MIRTARRTAAALLPILVSVLLPAIAVAGRGKIDIHHLQWDRYYSQQEVDDVLQALHAAYPRLTTLQSLGKSEEGRDIWELTINNPATGEESAKPAIYADGAIHGNEIQATEVCLYLAWQILDKYDKWDRMTAVVDSTVFYIVPTINVDSRARFFTDPGGYDIGRTARVPHDDDHDGLVDEDDYDDLDGDGRILQMRIRDPFGRWRSDPDDPRVMVRVKPGEQGQWTLLGTEGIDNDGDGRINEDVPGYLDMNRNWGFAWQPESIQSGAGDYPFSARVTSAVAAFLVSHPNICFGFNFHNYGGMWLRGPGSDLSPPIPPADLKVLDYLGREGERVVPGYRYLVSGTDLYTTHGDFDEFCYQCAGFPCFVGELFMSAQLAYRSRTGKPNGDDGTIWSHRPSEKEKQKFNDHLMLGEMFSDWHPFHHPTYGDIEIGGWRTFTTRMPPPFMLPELVHRNAMYVIWTATQAPRLELSVTGVKPLGDGLYRVRARAVNRGGIPTLTARARGKKILPLDRAVLAGKGITVVSGGVLTDPWFDKVERRDHHPESLPTWIAPFGKRDLEWIVAGGKGDRATVTYAGLKCGRREVSVVLP